MASQLSNLSGEELLLVSVLGAAKDRAAVDRELDRRALLGPPRRRSDRRGAWRLSAAGRYGDHAAA